MKAKSILTTAALIAAALFILDVPAAMATTYTWEGDTNVNWSNADNWAPAGGPPGAGDTANIPSGVITYEPTVDSTVTVATVTVGNGRTLTLGANLTVTSLLTINNGGTVLTGANTLTISGASGLTIDAGGLLNVDSGSGEVRLINGGTHTISGTADNTGLRLSVSGSTLRIESNNVTLSGTGYIDGRSNTARIEIAAEDSPGISLTSSIDIVGALEIAGLIADGKTTGTFTNSDTVHADGASGDKKITLVSGTIDGGGTWQVSHADAEIQFDVSATLTGTFDIDDGTLDINANVTTTGDLEFSGGTIEVAATKTFQAS